LQEKDSSASEVHVQRCEYWTACCGSVDYPALDQIDIVNYLGHRVPETIEKLRVS